MRIAIFTELYAPSIGGQETFFAGLARALVHRGHHIDVYCVGHQEGLAPKETINGVDVYRYPIEPKYKKPFIPAMKRNWRAIAQFAWRVRRVANQRQHDAYMLNQWPFLHAALLPNHASQRAILHWCEIRHSSLFRAIQRLLPTRVRLNAAISDSVGEQIRTASGREVITLPSGLDLDNANSPEHSSRRDILALGRVAQHKNLFLLLEAFEILKSDGYTGRLKIAGDGPDMEAVRLRVGKSVVREEIDLLGFVDNAAKFRLLAACEVLAMPSKREGFPNVVAEAMCCGLPIVTADYLENGTKTVVRHYECGLVTNPDAESFAVGIRKALSNWQYYSSNAVKGSTQLDWRKIAVDLETKLTQVASSGRYT